MPRSTGPRRRSRPTLLDTYAGLDLHQLRHSAATHLGDAEVPLQLIMGKARYKNSRTAMRYVKPGAEAIAAVTDHRTPQARRVRVGEPSAQPLAPTTPIRIMSAPR